jgi:hypothetical protein
MTKANTARKVKKLMITIGVTQENYRAMLIGLLNFLFWRIEGSSWVDEIAPEHTTLLDQLAAGIEDPFTHFLQTEGKDVIFWKKEGMYVLLPGENDPIEVIIPNPLVIKIIRSRKLEGQRIDLLRLALYKGLLAQHENADPRTYWPT